MASASQEHDGSQRIHSIEVAADILSRVDERGTVGVSDLAREMGAPKSTVHDYLASLAAAGLLRNDGGRYRLSLRFLEYGGHVRRRTRVFDAAKACVDDLRSEIDDFSKITVGVEEGGQRVLIYKVEGDRCPIDDASIGHRAHMHWTSIGKAILSRLPRERVHEILDEHGTPSATERTITDREALLQELETVREQGYAFEDEEHVTGVRAVAVPVLDAEGWPVCAVSISGPKTHFQEGRIDDLVEAIDSRCNVVEIQYQSTPSLPDA